MERGEEGERGERERERGGGGGSIEGSAALTRNLAQTHFKLPYW